MAVDPTIKQDHGNWRSVLVARFIPHLVIGAVLVAFVLSLIVGIGDLAVKGLIVYGVPTIGAALLGLRLRKKLPKDEVSADFKLRFLPMPHLALTFIILFFTSLILLYMGEERPPAYFIIVAVMVGIISLEILQADLRRHSVRLLILAQIGLLFLNFVFGITLKWPFYYGGGDTASHLLWINSILRNHQVTSELSYYQYFPLSHVFTATGHLLSGLDVKTAYFVFAGAAYTLAIFFTYLIVSRALKDPRPGLLAALLYSMNHLIIDYSTYIVPRTVAFVLCLAILYLIIRQNEARYVRLLSVLLIPPLIVWHQTTLAQFSAFLVAFIGIELILFSRSHIRYNYILLFTVAFLGYWLYSTRSFFVDIFFMAAEFEESRPAISVPTVRYEVPFISSLAQNSDFFILLFLAVLGAVLVLYQNRHKGSPGYTFALFSLAAIPFFIPSLSVLFNPGLLLYRTPPLVAVLFALTMAGAVIFLMAIKRKWWVATLCCLLITTYSFLSLIIFSADVDVYVKGLLQPQNRDYLTEMDLASMQFLHDYKGREPVGGDYGVFGYLRMDPALNDFYSFSLEDGEFAAPAGYYIFRRYEYYSRGILQCQINGTWTYLIRGSKPDLESAFAGRSIIYDNSAEQVYLNRP